MDKLHRVTNVAESMCCSSDFRLMFICLALKVNVNLVSIPFHTFPSQQQPNGLEAASVCVIPFPAASSN